MADQGREPTMEEILSSIKKIIADDSADKAAPKAAPRARASQPKADAADESPSADILELTESEEVAVPADGVCGAVGDDSLLDDSKAESLARSFTALQTLAEPGAAPQIVRSGETSLEGLVRDMMRPMLKDWLDQNLPSIVEAMVAREISRITKKN